MSGTAWKDLLTDLGCLDNGRFACPKDLREVFVTVSLLGGGVSLVLSPTRPVPAEWSYTDDFIIFEDTRGHATYYAWSGVASVMTNPM